MSSIGNYGKLVVVMDRRYRLDCNTQAFLWSSIYRVRTKVFLSRVSRMFVSRQRRSHPDLLGMFPDLAFFGKPKVPIGTL